MSGILNSILSSLKTNVMDYCDLEAPYTHNEYDGIFSTRNGGFMSMYEIKGATKFIGDGSFINQIEYLNDKLSKTMASPGYRLEFVFIRDPEQTKREVKANLEPMRRTLLALELDLEGLLDEREEMLSKNLVSEKCFLTVKTNPSIMPSSLISRANKKRIEKSKGAGVKPGVFSQSPYVAFDELLVNHTSFCGLIVDALQRDTLVKSLNHREALREIKIQIEPYSTGDNWTPSLLGDKISAKLIKEIGLESDISHLTNLDLGMQLFSRKPEHALDDYTSVKHDGVYYAPLIVDGAQSKATPFKEFFSSVPKEIPWRLNITIDTGHDNIISKIGRKRGFAAFLAFSNSENKLIRDACEELINIANRETVVATQITICTWAKSYDKLLERKENINQFFQNWGGLDVIDEAGDPIEAWLNTIPGLSGKKIATPIALPLEEILYMLPIDRPTSPWETGTTMLNTVDYKLYPTESASSIQSNTSELTFAPPGSGKSFKLSALNMALILKPGNTKLPKIKIIDIGFSSSSFVAMLREALPDSKKHLTQSITLENRADRAINMFTTPLGNRVPLSVDLQAQAGMLEMLLTPAGSESVTRLPEICSAIINELYSQFSDDREPSAYRAGINENIDNELYNLKFDTSYDRTWWEVVDFLFKGERVTLASSAQRYAMPLLSDVTSVIKSSAVSSIYENAIYKNENLLEFVSQMVISALQDYPILTQPSVIDVSAARILSIDLQNVAKKGNSQANKQTAIMFMLARSICCADFYFVTDTLNEINPEYRAYFEQLIEDEAGIPKKLCMDEFHRTEGFNQIREQVETDIREGRKYSIIVSLLSQSLDDFSPIMIEFSTSVYILAKGISEDTPRKIIEKFSPSEDAMIQFRRHVKAPGKEGSSMLFLADVNNSDNGVECVLRLRLGPREIWAYSTTPNDVALRSLLVKELGLNATLEILALEFPGGSSQKYLEAYKKQMTNTDINPITQIKDNLIIKYKSVI